MAHSASAATVSASASIDWSNLTIGFFPGSLSYTLADQSTSTSVSGTAGNDYDGVFDWTTAIGSSVSNANINASADADASALNAALTMTDDGFYAYQNAQSYRYGTINITGGPGILFVSAPATGAVSIVDWTAEYVPYVSAYSYLQLSKFNQNLYSYSQLFLSTCSGCELTESSDEGTLVVAISVTDGDQVQFYGASNAFAQIGEPTVVPVPGAVWLLGSALVGLGALKRRTA